MAEFSKPKGRGIERAARVSLVVAQLSRLVTNRFVASELAPEPEVQPELPLEWRQEELQKIIKDRGLENPFRPNH